MRRNDCSLVFATLLVVAGLTNVVRARDAPAYRTGAMIPLGTPDRWDYVTFDPTLERVYVAHGDRVTVVDARTDRVIGDVVGIQGGTHGIALSPKTGKVYTDDGKAGTAIPFDASSLKTGVPLKVGADADAVVADPVTGHLFVIDGDPGTISVIDPSLEKVVATIDGGGKLEFAVADGAGRLYVNGEANRDIVVVDTKADRVLAHWPISECLSPHGLAVDVTTHRLFASCKNERLVVVNADTGAVVATLPIGKGSDAVAFDPKRKRIFSSNGVDGTLSVIAQMDADTYAPAATIRTMVSGRTMAIDQRTGRIFLAAAETNPPTASGQRAKPRAGSLRLLVLQPVR